MVSLLNEHFLIVNSILSRGLYWLVALYVLLISHFSLAIGDQGPLTSVNT